MILAVVFPPFAVVDKGCGTYLVAFILTCLGWIPGIIYAFAVLKLEQRKLDGKSSHKVSKLQGKNSRPKTSHNSSNATPNAAPQSPFERKRRMSNREQSSNDTTKKWQGW